MSETPSRILIVDDDPGIRQYLHATLAAHEYSIQEAPTGEEALQIVLAMRPDVIILDLGLPGIGGGEVTSCLREWTQTPIIILSVQGDELAKVAALDAGADDYLTKPFSAGELLARIRAALRRASKLESGPVFVSGDLTVDLAARVVRCHGNKIQLTPTEFGLIKVLVVHADKVITHRQLVRELWGGACCEDTRHLLRVNVSNLRRKIEDDPTRPRYITTEPGVGYRLQSQPPPAGRSASTLS